MSSQGRRSFPPRLLERLRERVLRGNDEVRRLLDRSRALIEANAPTESVEATASSDAWVEVADEFATVTMGNILLAQGRKDEAIETFRRVLEREPEDQSAQQALVHALGDEILVAHEPDEPASMLDRDALPEAYGTTVLRVLPVDPQSIVVYWEFAHDVLGEPPPALCIQVISTTNRAEDDTESRRMFDDIPLSGNLFINGLEPGSMSHVSVGILIDGVFEPLLDAEPISTPRGRPATRIAQTLATIVIPPRVAVPGTMTPWIVPTVPAPIARPAQSESALTQDVPVEGHSWLVPVHTYESKGETQGERAQTPVFAFVPVQPRLIIHHEQPAPPRSTQPEWTVPLSQRPRVTQRVRVGSSDMWIEEGPGIPVGDWSVPSSWFTLPSSWAMG